jgi:hypothetical protein
VFTVDFQFACEAGIGEKNLENCSDMGIARIEQLTLDGKEKTDQKQPSTGR